VISIDWDGVEVGLKFSKEAEGALVPVGAPPAEAAREAAAASTDGRTTFFPAASAAVDVTSVQKATPVATRGVTIDKSRNERR
jgi:hypothetical protein